MTQRSILAGTSPNIVIRSGSDVNIKGWEDNRVIANTDGRWGLKVGRKGEATEISSSDSLQVQVPASSNVTVYAGKSVEVHDIQGHVSVYAGRDVRVRNVGTLVHATAGGAMDLDCEQVQGRDVKFSAGRDLRCHIKNLADAQVMVNDLGGYWEANIIGQRIRIRLKADIKIRLKAGGDVTLVTDQEVKGQPPNYLLGKIEKPAQPDH